MPRKCPESVMFSRLAGHTFLPRMLPAAPLVTRVERRQDLVSIMAKEDVTMGKERSGVFVCSITLAQNWGQSMVGIVGDKGCRQSPEARQGGAMRKVAFLPVGF